MTDDLDEWRQIASEQILDDESLTEELDDDAAEVLIRWGLAQVGAIAARAAGHFGLRAAPSPPEAAQAEHVGDEDAGALDDQAVLVRKLMRAASYLAAHRAEFAPDELRARAARLLSMSAALQGAPPPEAEAPPPAPPTEVIDLLHSERSAQEVLALLLKQLSPGAETTPPPPTPEEPPSDDPTESPV